MTPDMNLKAGAQARLQTVREKISALESAIAEHRRAIAELETQLPDLRFEEAAMIYIVEGQAPVQAPPAPAGERRKVGRPELVEIIKERMAACNRPLEVGELHAYLEEEAGLELGLNARNYLCGVLSRNKDVHFANIGKGAWWLAGRPAPRAD